MKIENMELYEKFRNTPKEARKEIAGGRLKGFTDINPMWRIRMLTEEFGPCGIGWHYTVMERELVNGANGEVKAFVQIALYLKTESGWSSAIIGEGGASFISAERDGKLYTDDEAFKKATTDAIGSACKLLGMSADIYFANDRTKYTLPDETPKKASTEANKKVSASASKNSKEDAKPSNSVGTRQMLKDLIVELSNKKGLSFTECCLQLEEKNGKMTADNVDKFIVEIRRLLKEEGK